MQRKNIVTMSGEEFDKIHTNLWLITDYIDNGYKTETLTKDIRAWAQGALDIMDLEDLVDNDD